MSFIRGAPFGELLRAHCYALYDCARKGRKGEEHQKKVVRLVLCLLVSGLWFRCALHAGSTRGQAMMHAFSMPYQRPVLCVSLWALLVGSSFLGARGHAGEM